MKKLLSLVALALLAVSAQAQFAGTIPTTVTLTNIPASIAAGTGSNVYSQFLIGDKGFAIMPTFAGSGASTANLTFYGDVSTDAATWTTNGTTYAFSASTAANGTGKVVGYMFISPTNINNVKWARINMVSNATAVTIFTTNVVVTTWK